MKLDEIKGLGSKRINSLKENGIASVDDLLTVFPYDYVDLKAISLPSRSVGREHVVLFGTVAEIPKVKYIRKGLFLATAIFKAEGGEEFECGWFNRKYLKNTLPVGKRCYVYGKVERYGKKLSVNNPTLIAHTENMPSVYPLYRPIKGVPSSVFMNAIDTVLNNVRISSYLNERIKVKFGLMELNKAFCCIHRPPNREILNDAHNSIAIENLSCNIALYSILKQSGNKHHVYEDNSARLKEFIEKLPFALSDDQSNAINEILSDLNSPKKMNRLLQGDVGCGKTIVALSAMLYAAMSGLQSVLMSPTEILAMQHFDNARKLFEPYGISPVFLSSAATTSKRREILERISTGEALVIIGTHALIQDDVLFKNLSLIITDEQQRFGVKQRGMLENKAHNADYLVMTATPIPRTLALTLYGDLDESAIRTLPKQKANTFTRFVPQNKTNDMLKYVLDKAQMGEQTYIVCPRIDDEELISVKSLYKKLQNSALKPYTGILHGQMSDEEKAKAMHEFSIGNTRALVTTSIIEVGIDVPNATSIIIFNAERYGLSQLHQMRGRVGRGSLDSYCFLLSDLMDSEKIRERIEYFISCRDGFALAEYDFKMRGAGDFLGTRQHGDSFFTTVDKSVIDTAKTISAELCASETFKTNILSKTQEGQLLFIEKLTLN